MTRSVVATTEGATQYENDEVTGRWMYLAFGQNKGPENHDRTIIDAQ